jgi:hypothetical protein
MPGIIAMRAFQTNPGLRVTTSIDRKVPPVTPHDKSLRVQVEALMKAFR